MKRIICAVWALTLGVTLLAQGTVNTRKYRYADFPDKITQVVLNGEDLLSGYLKQEVSNRWTASAFEFCSFGDFEKMKKQDHYFLLLQDVSFKGEDRPGIRFLSLLKGGPSAGEGFEGMDEIISLPVASIEGNGREFVFLGPLVYAVQTFVQAALESEKNAYLKSEWFNGNYKRYGKMMQVYWAEEDLSQDLDQALLDKYLDEDMHLITADEADSLFQESAYNSLVSYVVAPSDPENGSYCYKMLFEAESQQLFYIARHKISAKKGVGFLAEDLQKLARKR